MKHEPTRTRDKTRTPSGQLRPQLRQTTISAHPPPHTPVPAVLAHSGENRKKTFIDKCWKTAKLLPMTPQATSPIKEYLRKIGSIGGKKSAQHPDRPRLNREAAIARWRGHMPKPKEIPK